MEPFRGTTRKVDMIPWQVGASEISDIFANVEL